jgi:hypothetical protein
MNMNTVLQIIAHLMNQLPVAPATQPPQNSAITTDNIKLLLKHIKPFNGNSDEIITWISSWYKTILLARLSAENQLIHLAAKLTEPVFEWYNRLPAIQADGQP